MIRLSPVTVAIAVVMLAGAWGAASPLVTLREFYDNSKECAGDPVFARVQYSDMCMTPGCVFGRRETCRTTDAIAKAMPGQLVIFNATDAGELFWRYSWVPGCYDYQGAFRTIECQLVEGQLTPFFREWQLPGCSGNSFRSRIHARRAIDAYNATCPP